MTKYLSIFKVSFAQEFAYRLNFIMWRVRNVLQIFIVFFLWDTIFADPGRVLFGYDRARILTYVFGIVIVRAFVLSSRAVDVAGEISQGELSNYLLRPISYFKYWLCRDVSSKFLNLVFAAFETVLLYLILKPPFFIQTNFVYLGGFILTIAIAILLFFIILFITSSITFWMPELGWGAQFLMTAVIIEFLSGAVFPIDILPQVFQNILNYTPFPYLIFFPLQVYLGKLTPLFVLKGIVVSGVWLVLLWFLMNSIWRRGLKAYQAYGR
jgi:ABC-2 type transport system permease protein